MRIFGLIGYPLDHSFSERYFNDFFREEEILDASYQSFPLREIKDLEALIESQEPNLVGLNVTAPYKIAVLDYLTDIHPVAKEIGAVNTIYFHEGQRIGYNTDYIGFLEDVRHWFEEDPKHAPEQAIIIGYGGAAMGIRKALEKLELPYVIISRRVEELQEECFKSYQWLNQCDLSRTTLWINCTPIGQAPNTQDIPPIKMSLIKPNDWAYDLIYNPTETTWLTLAKSQGARIKNGLGMLYLQAQQAWNIWNANNLKESKPLLRTHTITAKAPINFENTELAFGYKSDKDLKKTARLFNLLNKGWIVNMASGLGLVAVKWHLPFARTIMKNTLFEQFVGGTTLLNTYPLIQKLGEYNVLTCLDYGAEGKEVESDFNLTMNECIRAIEFAKRSKLIPVISTKLTGLTYNNLLAKVSRRDRLNINELKSYRNFLKRVDSICYVAKENGVSVFIDAEESWMQPGIDHVVSLMMRRYNKALPIVYNTYQMYRHDRLKFLMDSYELANKEGFVLGAKIVRGAYMDKERIHAEEKGIKSPINANKAATDHMYNTAIRFCLDHVDDIATCIATHNRSSCDIASKYIDSQGIERDHPHVMFSQLLGMSDNLTFNLAYHGFRVAKYMPYGSIDDVAPYLIRRAQENTAVLDEVSRELSLINKELNRRGLV